MSLFNNIVKKNSPTVRIPDEDAANAVEKPPVGYIPKNSTGFSSNSFHCIDEHEPTAEEAGNSAAKTVVLWCDKCNNGFSMFDDATAIRESKDRQEHLCVECYDEASKPPGWHSTTPNAAWNRASTQMFSMTRQDLIAYLEPNTTATEDDHTPPGSDVGAKKQKYMPGEEDDHTPPGSDVGAKKRKYMPGEDDHAGANTKEFLLFKAILQGDGAKVETRAAAAFNTLL